MNSRQQLVNDWAHMMAINQSNVNRIEISTSWPYNGTVFHSVYFHNFCTYYLQNSCWSRPMPNWGLVCRAPLVWNSSSPAYNCPPLAYSRPPPAYRCKPMAYNCAPPAYISELFQQITDGFKNITALFQKITTLIWHITVLLWHINVVIWSLACSYKFSF